MNLCKELSSFPGDQITGGRVREIRVIADDVAVDSCPPIFYPGAA